MDSEFPGVAEGADHLGFAGEVFVFAVFDIAFSDEGLEVASVFDSVRGVHINALDFSGHGFFFQQGVDDEEGVAGDEAVGPVLLVLVELDGALQRGVFLGLFEGELLSVAVFLLDGADDGAGVDSLVDVERMDGDVELVSLLFLVPAELGVEVGVELVLGVGLLLVVAHEGDSGGGVVVSLVSGVVVLADFSALLFLLLLGLLLGAFFRGAAVESLGGHVSLSWGGFLGGVREDFGGVGGSGGIIAEKGAGMSRGCRGP